MNTASTPIFIINLPKSVERQAFITEQFNHINQQHNQTISYQFFEAINGKENPDFYLFKKYNKEKRFARKGNEMNLSQLGCFASHYLLWEKCVELNQGIIVLEDDAIIHPEFASAYSFISSDKNQFEFFWLSPPAPVRRTQKGKVIYHLDDKIHSISEFYKEWANATGYYINPVAAKKLLNYTSEWVYDLDISMDRYWENKLKYYALVPACVEPDFSKESNIPVNKGNKNRTFFVKIKREYYKLMDNIRKFIFNLIK